MPNSPSTFRFENGKTIPSTSRSYSDDDLKGLAAYLRGISKTDPPNEDLIWSVIGGIEDAAQEFFAVRSFVLSDNFLPSNRRKKLRGVEKAATDFLDAMANVDAFFWLNAYMAGDDLPEKKRMALHDGDTDALFPMVRRVQAFAANSLENMQNEKMKPGDKQNKAVAKFAYRLTRHYEKVTGKEPTAYSSENYQGPLGHRATPFVRFVAACLEPICPEEVTPQLGDIIYNQLFRAARKKTAKRPATS